jgi:hypothetical protein
MTRVLLSYGHWSHQRCWLYCIIPMTSSLMLTSIFLPGLSSTLVPKASDGRLSSFVSRRREEFLLMEETHHWNIQREREKFCISLQRDCSGVRPWYPSRGKQFEAAVESRAMECLLVTSLLISLLHIYKMPCTVWDWMLIWLLFHSSFPFSVKYIWRSWVLGYYWCRNPWSWELLTCWVWICIAWSFYISFVLADLAEFVLVLTLSICSNKLH